ncbi:uncharacterized protein SS50377_28772 [Spironucleus salmonicida]|uniref:Uncharacterized protein n=1 Tax=Spironucleus salmonicida TaxID=348837 RepID=A0A9P8LJ07_9EUKA|nr:hypothetical protein SS50377_28772 [Spironucleus salmonicida]
MSSGLSIEFKALPYSVDQGYNVIINKKIKKLKFTIRDNEISQSIQLDSEQKYILCANVSTKEQLCAVQIVLLYKKLKKIIPNCTIQLVQKHKFFAYEDLYFWNNIGIVAAQMGLKTKSIKIYKDHKGENQTPDLDLYLAEINQYDLQYISFYDSFDTLTILQPEGINKCAFHENLILIQLAAIQYQHTEKYPLILPLVFGFSAYQLYTDRFVQIFQKAEVASAQDLKHSILRKIFELSNIVYNEQVLPDKFKVMNLFQLPIHFIGTGICLFMFQQLCHVSYLFKAEYFALFSLVNNDFYETLTNAVISQSSRSGKSVALYTQYFFHLLKGNVPILLNKKGSDDQPLYKYRTHSFHEQLVDQYKNIFELQNLKNYKEKVLADVCKFHTFQLESIDQMSFIYQTMIIFINKIQGNLQLVQKLKYDNSIQLQFDQLKLASFFIIDTANIINDIDQVLLKQQKRNNIQLKHPIILVDECLQSQKEKFSKCVKLCQLLFKHYEEKLIKLGKDQYLEIQSTLDNAKFWQIGRLGNIRNTKYHLAINVIQQLLNTDLLLAVKRKLDRISGKLKYEYQDISLYQTVENIITSVQSQTADQRFDTIHANQEIIVEYFKSLNNILGKSEYILIAMEHLHLEIDDYDLLDELVVHSPQILNTGNRTDFRKILFSGMASYRNRGQYYEDFEVDFFKFILQLFNPRGVETSFWKAFSIIAFKKIEHSQVDDKLSKDKKEEKTTRENAFPISQQGMLKQYWSSSVQSLICKYFMNTNTDDLHQDLQQMILKLPKMSEQYSTKYEMPNFDYFTVIMAGTDLAIINCLTLNQFCYNTMLSRGWLHYINTQILGYVQPHASLLSSLQYEQRRMVVDDKSYKDSINNVEQSVKTFAKDTPILVSLLYSMMTEKSVEMQFMCSSVCPSIWFQHKQKILNFNATSRHVVSFCVEGKKLIPEQTMYQFDSLTQTYNNIIIHKGAEKKDKFQLTKGYAHFNLLKNNQNYNISCIASSTLNYEVVSVLNYQLMLAFIEQYSTSQIDEAEAQATLQQLSKFFQRSVLLEFMQVILFMAKLTWQSEILIMNISLIMKQVDTGHVYVQYLHGGSIDSEKSESVFSLLRRTSVPHKFMFLNPTFDYAFQNFNKKSSISIYEQVLKDSVAAANETFQLLRQRLPVQPESTTKKEEPSAKEAIVEQDGGAQTDVGSTPPPQESQLPKTQDEAYVNLKDKQTGPMLIIVIPFDKKMCFTDSLDKARHKIFDFIVTFHGYPDLSLETIDGCQVLPIECGHHIPEVLAKKIKAFTLNNVLQIGLDKEGATQLLEIKDKSEQFVLDQQTKERLPKQNVPPKFEDKMQCQVFKIKNPKLDYTEIFAALDDQNIMINIFKDNDYQYLLLIDEKRDCATKYDAIREKFSVEAKDSTLTIDKLCSVRGTSILHQYVPQGFILPKQTVNLDLKLIQDYSIVVKKLATKFQSLHFTCNNSKNEIQVTFNSDTDLLEFLTSISLGIVSIIENNNIYTMLVVYLPDEQVIANKEKEALLEKEILKNIYKEPLYEICKKNYDAYGKSGKVKMLSEKENQYEHIRLFENDPITCMYGQKDKAFTLSKEQLLDHLTVYQSIISKFEEDIVYLDNGEPSVKQMLSVHQQSLVNFNDQGNKYFAMFLNALRLKSYKLTSAFLGEAPLQIKFNKLVEIQREQNGEYGLNICINLQSAVSTSLLLKMLVLENKFLTFKQDKKFDQAQIYELFFSLKIILHDIVEDVAHIVILPE